MVTAYSPVIASVKMDERRMHLMYVPGDSNRFAKKMLRAVNNMPTALGEESLEHKLGVGRVDWEKDGVVLMCRKPWDRSVVDGVIECFDRCLTPEAKEELRKRTDEIAAAYAYDVTPGAHAKRLAQEVSAANAIVRN